MPDRALVLVLVLASALGSIAACTTLPAEEEPSLPAPAPVESAPPPVPNSALIELLEAGDRAIAKDHLTTPPEDNAFAYYSRALALAPAHPDVLIGFERIVERYLALAQQAIERQRWAGARTMLERARLVDPKHPGIDALRRQVDLLASARRLTLALDQRAVRGRQQASAARLATFGKSARQANARVTIRAASDADGRWIYQQLSKSPGTQRIRASMAIGRPPLVTIVLLPTQAAAHKDSAQGAGQGKS